MNTFVIASSFLFHMLIFKLHTVIIGNPLYLNKYKLNKYKLNKYKLNKCILLKEMSIIKS